MRNLFFVRMATLTAALPIVVAANMLTIRSTIAVYLFALGGLLAGFSLGVAYAEKASRQVTHNLGASRIWIFYMCFLDIVGEIKAIRRRARITRAGGPKDNLRGFG